ncbi:MAG: hypothetical protein MJZ71_02795 [Bacteroidales bacterium]|nr:hypothetical protein [Bacteroidales bacterium]
MRLFIFEGEGEERVFKTLQHLFLTEKDDEVVCIFKSNIYALYSKLKEYSIFADELQDDSELDIVSILNEILVSNNDHTLEKYVNEGIVFAEVFLFFDYDFHHNRGCTLQDNNMRIKEMLDFFSDETENGKIYINYPMLEAYRYIKSIPDKNFSTYNISIEQSKRFKQEVATFSKYSVDHFALNKQDWLDSTKREKRLLDTKKNWIGIIPMNVSKANYICCNNNNIPKNKTDIEQDIIFNNQLYKYVEKENCHVSVLSSFPLFLYEYLKPEIIGL